MTRRMLLALMLAGSCYSLMAQADSIDLFIKMNMQKRNIPGLQLAIVQNGKLVKAGNYGWANLQDSVPVSDKTVFSINSITKAFTGVAILQLAEAGKLELDETVSTYLGGLPAAWHMVTVQQLLSHTSGLPFIVDEEESVLISPFGMKAAWEQLITLPVVSAPGEKFSYNQTNYLLLGRIIDTLSGRPFTEFIIQGQLRKAGMHQTIRAGFGATKEVIAHAAAGYRFAQGRHMNLFFSFPPALQTAAGMSATATEVAAWIMALQAGRLLQKPSSLALLWKPALLNNGDTGGFDALLNGYAAGWPVIARKKHPAVAAVGGGRNALFVYTGDNLAIVVLTNLAGALPEQFMDRLAAFYIPGLKE